MFNEYDNPSDMLANKIKIEYMFHTILITYQLISNVV